MNEREDIDCEIDSRVAEICTDLYEAAVAARDGREGAAAWLVRRIEEEIGSPSSAAFLNAIRPADYWTHG